METEAPPAGRQPKESVELTLRMSHTLTLPMALCDPGADSAALVGDLSSAAPGPASNAIAGPTPATVSLFPSGLRQP
jgi:mitotic-spindle organizing protein 1